ncbi:YceI family protein [Epibacterium ulvae]|uniref:YceI family protein n=1 Tax=Epibacterium ulvae TaxID=1156985 RepID=UPI001BFCC489|nr:YceI family protein [Epibacterium ulvae]MBT8152581.1 YceI family protein [Epibacterium ulvae]
MKRILTAAALIAAGATAAVAAPEKYVLDPGHSNILFSFDHLGFSTIYGMFSGFEGEIMFDQEDVANSSVSIEFPVTTMLTGWEARLAHFMSEDFFNAAENESVTFVSTDIKVTGQETALITGDLTMNGVTKSVVLNAELNGKTDAHPFSKGPWAGFNATTTLLRTDFGLGKHVPFVTDEIPVVISIEAGKAE